MLVQVSKHDYCELLQFVEKSTKALKFKANLQIYDVSLSGILVAKSDTNKTVLVSFVNEFGIKYFDARITNSNPEMLYCVKQLDKKILTNVLLHDLAVLFLAESEKQNPDSIELGKYTYRYIQNNSKLLQVEEISKNKKISTFTKAHNEEIVVNHTSPKISLSLKPI